MLFHFDVRYFFFFLTLFSPLSLANTIVSLDVHLPTTHNHRSISLDQHPRPYPSAGRFCIVNSYPTYRVQHSSRPPPPYTPPPLITSTQPAPCVIVLASKNDEGVPPVWGTAAHLALAPGSRKKSYRPQLARSRYARAGLATQGGFVSRSLTWGAFETVWALGPFI